jgi:hypothetical protein
MRLPTWLLSLALLGACGDDGNLGERDGPGSEPAACTPDEQGIAGTALDVVPVDLSSSGVAATTASLLTSSADVAVAFPDGDAPQPITDTDFAVDRIVLGSSNPSLRFAVDDGTRLVVGEEPLCQGAAPGGVAYIVRGTTRNQLEVVACPYRGPEPCLAP